VRRLALLLAGCAVWLLVAAVPVFADNGPHQQGASSPTTDGCSGCHRAHTAQGANLLAGSSQMNLCYTCHGTSGTGATTDVQDGVQYEPATTTRVITTTRTGTLAGALRGGGFDRAVLDTSLGSSVAPAIGTIPLPAGNNVTSKHNVDAAGTAWGWGDISGTSNPGTSVDLTCASCHDPHGNTQYRILKPTPDDAYTGQYTGYNINIPNMSNISIADTTSYIYTTTNYWQPADPTAGNTYIKNVSSWCSSCHTRYLAGGGSAQTSSGDAIFNYRHETDGIQNSSNDSTPPTCVQCHVAHGSNASMGVNSQAVPMPGASTGRGTDSSLLRIDNRGTCVKCHPK